MAFEESGPREFIIREGDEEIVVVRLNVGSDETTSVDDFCRLCHKQMRINGVIRSSMLIFTVIKNEPKSMSERLADLGLMLKPSERRSKRMCSQCFRLVLRLENDLSVLRKWKEEEETADINEETTNSESTAESESSAKRGRSPDPPAAPRPLPKKLRTSLPPRRSVTQVITSYANKSDVKVAHESEAGIVYNVAYQKWRTAVNLLSTHKELFDEVKLKILVGVNEESQRLSNPYNKCMLWKTSPDDLRSFSTESLVSELGQRSPLLWSIFQTITKGNNEVACAALCIALRGRESRLSALAYRINSIIASGSMKNVFTKLSQMGITTSYSQALVKQKEMKGTAQKPTQGETPPEVEISAEPLQNPDEEMDQATKPESLGTKDPGLESLGDPCMEEELSCLGNIT